MSTGGSEVTSDSPQEPSDPSSLHPSAALPDEVPNVFSESPAERIPQGLT
eukprot:CAMPEP_0169439072 /NCGR_PEP_ID=MMETSP1042-20121227/7011_1 /TAXON_ID=464988 /ORGANISM="Hemiselmis andersenii, Strain CCMP1180" /LENGTH=49 /DNA_ID=CAMNT_0009549977 /DNA_START=367 /DNA_END=516 /DNA_ORIENTATION=+